MHKLRSSPGPFASPVWRLPVWLAVAAAALFVCNTAIKAIQSPWLVDEFPEALAVKAELMPLTFAVHMVSGGLALLLVPAAVLLSDRPRWHRPLARIAALDVVLAGLTAYPVALVAPVTQWSAWGFAAQATVWLALLGVALRHIRRGDRQRHRRAMLLMAATMSGAVFFRIYLALWAIFAHGRHYELAYALDAWIAWLLPLGLTAWGLGRSPRNSAHVQER